ncbi:NADP oxidoreductase [Modestobacter sp. I12A-02628]|uniref:NAD(P)-binding domain-containing protein n=1 Tax=Goekera deserti TaxID=2497753 RepID=A0A7K3WDV4_9ACTN|nr:NAD(P)-binding domain-containing protein [Goekera deserti]MPQ98364.1 NADP oxidoreductase [Goekera deserti]NDI48191.1 NAD(P)-binding domain-containing protein [Goekera deserti]NEL53940.1 NAD(P)-binding domain-containing protein [Goekera deserti]
MTTVGIIGAGNIGAALAKISLDAGYDVVIANSRGPETLGDLVAELGARETSRATARAATAAEAGAAGDLVVVTVPLKNVPDLPVEPLAGKVVIDTNNYYPERDGHIAALDDETTTTAELLQAHLPTSTVVKAFNHIYSEHLVTKRSPSGTPHRRALAIAGDLPAAKTVVGSYIDDLGFDVLDLGPLAEGWRIQRDTPGYGPEYDVDQLRQATEAAKRYRDM